MMATKAWKKEETRKKGEQRLRRLHDHDGVGKSSLLTRKVSTMSADDLVAADPALLKDAAVKTRNEIIKLARSLWAWCSTPTPHGAGWRKSSPAAGLKLMKGEHAGKQRLSPDEHDDFQDTALALAEKGDVRAVAALLASIMGPRAGEIRNLHVDDIGRAGDWFRPDGKTGERTIPIHDPDLHVVLAAFVAGRAPDEVIFPGRGKDGCRGDNGPCACVKYVCGEARITVITAQGMRSTLENRDTVEGLRLQLAAAKVGNSARVARRHYLERGAEEAGRAARLAAARQRAGRGKETGKETPALPEAPASTTTPRSSLG